MLKKFYRDLLLKVQARSQSLRPISISLSPNTERDDVWLAFRLLFQPWRWKQGIRNKELGVKSLEDELKDYLGARYVISFNSGRSAWLAILQSLGLQKNDEVLLQVFTCNAVPNPILWAGLKPVYVDCDDNFNIDTEDLKKKITAKSKAVVIQHTFGLPANIDEILEICRLHNLIVIEDCAHALGAIYKGRRVGTFGNVAFFSFSRDKVISSVYGGVAVTNDDTLAEKLRKYQEKVGYPSYRWICRQLLHPILMNWLILPTYRIFGKYLLSFFQWFGILSKAVDWTEKRGKKPSYFPKKMPDVLAMLAIHQLKKLEQFQVHRKELALYYYKELRDTELILPSISSDGAHIFLRFPVRSPRAHELIKKCWQNNILIGDWYTTPIAPHDTRLDKMQYTQGSCPNAEKLAKETFNLPTHINISQKEAQKIINFLKTLVS
jgi:perosamine synthetase